MSKYVEEYWDQQAREHGDSHVASWGDIYAINLEIETIGQFISQNDDVLDVGCGNGFSTFNHLQKGVRSIFGIDFSEEMIKQAVKRVPRVRGEQARVSFEVGDIRNLRFDNDSFDVVYTTRVLINLPTWKEQIHGIDECLRVCKPGGNIILSEGFWEPLVLLNALRALKQLPPLVEHDFNRYLKKTKLESYLESKSIQYEVVDFSSIYYLGSRFLRELVTNPDDYPGYSNPINEIFYNIEKEYSGGEFGIQQAYAITK